jgi:hypothetical protein
MFTKIRSELFPQPTNCSSSIDMVALEVLADDTVVMDVSADDSALLDYTYT